jgi:cytochrome b pre-mRNA-processing protein 3
MHLWFLHKRLIHDDINKDQALMIQEELFGILWEDTMCRIRREGVSEILVNKNLKQVQHYTFVHLTQYDHAFTELLDKPKERLNELRAIVWRNILVRDEDAEHRTDHLNRIAWYIEANYQNIMMHWPYEYYKESRVAWVDLPSFSNMKDASGNLMVENPVNPDDVLPDPWRRNITLRGIYYYWNPKTGQVAYDRPSE